MGKITATFFAAANDADLETEGIGLGNMLNFCHTSSSKEIHINNSRDGLETCKSESPLGVSYGLQINANLSVAQVKFNGLNG